MSAVIKRNFHVVFSVDQRASMGMQLAELEGTIEKVEDEKAEKSKEYGARLKTLEAASRELSLALRTGEGEITVDCVWRDDPHRPFRHLWRLDIFEICETQPLEKGGKGKQAKMDLTTPSGAAAPTGDSAAPGSEPGAEVITVKFGPPPPPCPVPVDGNEGGICGADGDREACQGLCPMHFAQLDPQARAALLDAIYDRRRKARLEAAADRQRQQVADATISAEEEERIATARLAAALAIACETCGSDPGVGCIDNGTPTEKLHPARLAAARVTTEATAPGQQELAGIAGTAEQPAPVAPPEASASATDAPAATAEPDGPPPFDEAPTAAPVLAGRVAGPYVKFNADGWALCPQCGADELHSAKTPPALDFVVGCFSCGWRPSEADAAAVRTSMAAAISSAYAAAASEPEPAGPPEAPAAVEPPGASVIEFENGDRIDTTGLPDPQSLVRTGPCKHRDTEEPCIICTRAAVAEARGLPSERQLAAEMASSPPGDAPAVEVAKCPAVRITVSAEQAAARKVPCASCSREINIRPKLEGGVWKATVATHNRGSGA